MDVCANHFTHQKLGELYVMVVADHLHCLTIWPTTWPGCMLAVGYFTRSESTALISMVTKEESLTAAVSTVWLMFLATFHWQ